VEDVFRTALEFGGTISGEHGIGTLKRPYLAWEQSPPVMELQRAIRRRWDPAGILNPGKLL
jgi:glycolate oxidase